MKSAPHFLFALTARIQELGWRKLVTMYKMVAKTELLIFMILASLFFVSCEKNEQAPEEDGQEQGGNTGEYDPDEDGPMEEFPPLEEVDDVCTKMDDINFMAYCYDNFDVNDDGKVSMSEANAVKSIECNNAESFAGIGYFSNLETFKSSSVKTVNFGYNKKLLSTDCSGSTIGTIDLRYNSLLKDINFSNCNSLIKILLADDASLEFVEESDFKGCTILETISLPDNCSIGDRAFYNLSKLAEVKLPKKLKTIGAYAFSDCTGLVSIKLPERLISINDYAFKGCTNLNSIYFPENLTTIGCATFYECKNLKDITLPDTILEIGEEAFSGCSGLESVIFPEGLQTIGCFAFKHCESLKSVILPSSLTSWDYGFADCTNLSSVTFPHGLKTIGAYAFKDCESLKSVILPPSLTSWNYGFADCTNLSSVTFPHGLKTIGAYAFKDCKSLKSVSLPATLDSWNGAFSGCSGLVAAELNEGLEKIAEGAFEHCVNLVSIKIPDGVSSIGSYAFNGCLSLTSVVLPSSLVSIGNIIDPWDDVEGGGDIEIGSVHTVQNYELYDSDEGHVDATTCTGLEEVNMSVFKECPRLTTFMLGAKTPPELECDRDLDILKVPAESVEAYKNSDWATYFKIIEAL